MPSTPPADPGQIAGIVVNWSAFVLVGFTLLLTVFTLIFILAGFFGVRELKSIRQAGRLSRQRADAQLAEVENLLEQTRREVETIDERLGTLVEVSYLFNQGEAAYREGSYEKAVEFLGRAAEIAPRNEQVLYRLGRSLTNLGDDRAASIRFQEARELGLPGGAAERGLALAYRYTQPNQALRYAQQAVDADRKNARNWNCLGLILRDSGNFEGSRQAHEQAAEFDHESVTTPFYLALLQASQGAVQRAITECHEAVYRLESQERLGKIKPMWAGLIRWADYMLRGQYDKADELTPRLMETCKSRRRARELGGHMDFLLRALSREELRDHYLGPLEGRWPPSRSEHGNPPPE